MRIFNLKNLLKINDVFYINKRLSIINKNFELFYNPKLKRYEVHDCSKSYSFITSCKNYPNSQLINKILSMNHKSIKQTLKEIDDHNNKIEINQEEKISLLKSDQIAEIVKFSNKKLNQNLSNSQIKKIIQL